MITRRKLLIGSAASMVMGPAVAQQNQQSLIIRPNIPGVDPRYAGYATVGNFHIPQTPTSLRTTRSRVVVFYPLGIEEARVIVFSHATLADPMVYRTYLEHLASHGFIVAAPIHDDAAIESGFRLRKTNVTGAAEWNIKNLLRDERAWRERTDACSSCLDAIPLISDILKLRVSMERPLIFGHGYGAFVAQLLLGTTVAGEENRLGFRDTRFFGGLLMSPQGVGVMGLDEKSWSTLNGPLLTLVAEGDRDFDGQDAARKTDPFKLSPPGYKHLGVLKGGSQSTFSGQKSSIDPKEAKLSEIIKAMSTCFAKAYSSYDQQAFEDLSDPKSVSSLEPSFFQRMTLGAVVESRR